MKKLALKILVFSLFLLEVLGVPVAPAAETQRNLWEFAGWYGGGMYPKIVADPQVEGRLYLTSDVAGLWRSDDRGETWNFINKGLTNLIIASLAIAPSDSNIIYIGTPKGLLRSDNAGESWKLLEETAQEILFHKPASYRAIAIDYLDPRTLWVGTKAGKTYFSRDAGESWKQLGKNSAFSQKTPVTAIQSSADRKTIFASSTEGVMRLDLASQKWEKTELQKPVRDLFIAKDGTIYVTQESHIAISRDSGSDWSVTSNVPFGEVSRIDVSGGADGSLMILAGTSENWKGGIYSSIDGGKTWMDLKKKLIYDQVANPTRAWMKGISRPNGLAIDPFNTQVFYLTDSWGVWRSNDAGQSWVEKIKGAPNTTGVDISVTQEGSLLVGTMDQGMLASSDGGKSYQVVLPTQGGHEAGQLSGHYWRVLPTGDFTYIASSTPWYIKQNQIFAGDFKTQKYQRIVEGLPNHTPVKNTFWGQGYTRAFARDSLDKSTFYLGIDGDDGGGFFYSKDSGVSWTRAKSQPPFLKIYNGLDVDPETGRIYWAACGGRGGIYTADAPEDKWKERYFGPTCFFDLKASSNGKVYAMGAEKTPVLYVSKDHGEKWKLLYRFETGAAAEALVIDPENPDRLFIGLVTWGGNSGGKVLMSGNGGKDWQDITAGLPENCGPSAMAINPKDSMLYVMLYAGGVYKRSLSSIYEMGNDS